MANKSTSSPSNTPWREGRPSFKGYRVEFFLLILLTLVCVVCAFLWSVSVVKKERKESQSSSTSFYAAASFAFAQDASIDELDKSTQDKASEQAEEKTSSADAVDAATNVVAKQSSAALAKVSDGNWKLEVLYIWCVCLIVPLVLWIWRGWVWFSTLYGIKYELRCDADNPKATTFLITRGIFHKRTDSMHIGQITDIHSEQSLLQKYLLGGIGNVILHTKDLTDPTVNMKNMDEPNRVFNAFDELRRHYWGRGGFQVNQDGGDGLDGDVSL